MEAFAALLLFPILGDAHVGITPTVQSVARLAPDLAAVARLWPSVKPNRPTIDRVDDEMCLVPGIKLEDGANGVLRVGVDDEDDAVFVSQWPTHDDEARLPSPSMKDARSSHAVCSSIGRAASQCGPDRWSTTWKVVTRSFDAPSGGCMSWITGRS